MGAEAEAAPLLNVLHANARTDKLKDARFAAWRVNFHKWKTWQVDYFPAVIINPNGPSTLSKHNQQVDAAVQLALGRTLAYQAPIDSCACLRR